MSAHLPLWLRQLFVVDVMNFGLLHPTAHGVLIPAGGDLAVEYTRTGGFSYGGQSVLGHEAVFGPDDVSSLKADDEIASGAFGSVYKARPHGAAAGRPASLAVKKV